MIIDYAIRYLHPNAVVDEDYVVQDNSDGLGPHIAYWNPALGAQPTMAELQAVETEANNAELSRRKDVKVDVDIIKAVVKFFVVHINESRSQHGLTALTAKQVKDEIKSYL